MTEPSKIPVPFAEAGTKNEIPQTTDERGRASWGTGFPAETSIPVTEGGVAPKRADFNGLFHALSAAEQWEQQGNLWSYDDSVDYQPNAIVTYNGEIYLCASANGPSTAVKSPLETAFWTALTSGGRLNTAALAQGTANISISGSSEKAVADGEGNNIHDTYMPQSGGNFTGDVTVMGESILTQAGGTVFGNLEVKGTTTARGFTSGTIVDETGVTNEVTMSLDNAVTDGTSSGVDDSVFKVSVKGHDFKFDSKTAETVFEITPKMGAYLNGVKMATLSSNVATATKLATARNINGVAFDGTKDITVKDNTKLPLSGGTMTGTIFAANPYILRVPTNDSFVNINGDTDNGGGAYIQIFGRNHSFNPGEIKLIANTTGSETTLRLYPSGILTWPGTIKTNKLEAVGIELKTAIPFIDFHYGASSADYTGRIIQPDSGVLQFLILNSAGNESAMNLYADGDITWRGCLVAHYTGTNLTNKWVRLNNGIQVCWGLGYYEANAKITYPIAFYENPGIACNSNARSPTNWSTTGFAMEGNASYAAWIAVGRWA